MTIYARVSNGVVQEIINPLLDDDGIEFQISIRFTPDIVAQMVDITDCNPMPACWWAYDGRNFSEPAPEG
jgi:hypothetical protein